METPVKQPKPDNPPQHDPLDPSPKRPGRSVESPADFPTPEKEPNKIQY